MLQLAPDFARFQLTAPRPCAYLPGQSERLLFTWAAKGTEPELYDYLSVMGFRRSRLVLYRPICPDCSACLSARVCVDAFSPSKSQRKTIRRNCNLARVVCSPKADSEIFELFKRYVAARHGNGGMDDMSVEDFSRMIDESPTQTRIVKYFEHSEEGAERTLVAAALTDMLQDGLSMLYSFYDPDRAKNSFGTYMVLDHIDIAKEDGLKHVYLGYWVPGSKKMDYKRKFGSLEIFFDNIWHNIDDYENIFRSRFDGSLDRATVENP